MKGFPGHRWFGMVAYPERSTAAVTHNRSRTQIPTGIRTAARGIDRHRSRHRARHTIDTRRTGLPLPR